jgi:hypothetical protein
VPGKKRRGQEYEFTPGWKRVLASAGVGREDTKARRLAFVHSLLKSAFE